MALAQNSQENYENVLKLWSALKINEFQGSIATDLKLANILVGIMAHSSSFPCTYCFVSKNELGTCGEYRTVHNTIENYKKWLKVGANKDDAKKFKNCIHPPVSSTRIDRLFLLPIPPPQLHLFLGVINTSYKHLLEKSKEDVLMWAKACHVAKDVRQNGSSFNGNACKILLN